MPVAVGVVFKSTGKVYYFDPAGLELKGGDKVIVKTSQGQEFGEVVSAPEEVPDEEITAPLKKVLHKATSEDLTKAEKNAAKEKEAFEVCEKKIVEHKLPMKLVEVEYFFDGSKIVFYFTSETRVDFRDLVKELASTFKTRIELRQIGVRDEAKMIGGLGPCGRRLCCTVFSKEFEPVSIRMAKDQDLPLNPMKISGICGRLMCCLRYEHEIYKEFKKGIPKRGQKVETPQGEGVVADYNVPQEKIVVEFEGGRQAQIPLAEVKVVKGGRKEAKEKKK